MTLQPKLTKSISNFYKDLKTRTAPCIIRIPAHEIEKMSMLSSMDIINLTPISEG